MTITREYEIPDLPEDTVALGFGGEFKILPNRKQFEAFTYSLHYPNAWIKEELVGIGVNQYYAAPIGSEIALLNGHTQRPIRDWLNELPDGVAEAAISQIDESYERFVSHPVSLREALDVFNKWDKTNEWRRYWYSVNEAIISGKDIPPLPKSKLPEEYTIETWPLWATRIRKKGRDIHYYIADVSVTYVLIGQLGISYEELASQYEIAGPNHDWQPARPNYKIT